MSEAMIYPSKIRASEREHNKDVLRSLHGNIVGPVRMIVTHTKTVYGNRVSWVRLMAAISKNDKVRVIDLSPRAAVAFGERHHELRGMRLGSTFGNDAARVEQLFSEHDIPISAHEALHGME